MDTPTDALHVFAKNKSVDAHNTDMLLKNCQEREYIEAEDYSSDVRNERQRKLASPRVGSTDDLPDVLSVGVGARVMLLRNIDVGDGLVNGAFGTIHGFDHTGNSITSVHVKFDSDKVGSKRKLENGCVAIERHEDRLNRSKNVTRRQFPLKLAWACSIHKVQGMTVKEIVFDMEGTFTYGQAYVALSRATTMDGLYLRNYKPNLIYRSEPVHAALQNMTSFNVQRNTSNDDNAFSVIHQNVQGLSSKARDLEQNTDMKGAAVIAFTETWLSPQSNSVALDGYDAFRCDRSDGRGGVCIYAAKDSEISRVAIQSDLEHCCVTCESQEYGRVMIVAVYRSPRLNLGYFIPRLEELLLSIGRENCEHVIIVGDFNEDQLKDGNHPITGMFANFGYQQTVKGPTSVHGSLLDLVFVKTRTLQHTTSILPTYYSDHEAIKISLSHK